MSSKYSTWFWALFSLSVFLRCVFFTGLDLYVGAPISAIQWVVTAIVGLGSLCVCYRSFGKLFGWKGASQQLDRTTKLSKLLTWLGALFFLSVFLRCAYVLGLKWYAGESISGAPSILVPIGLAALYMSYLYLKGFLRDRARAVQPR